MQQVLKARTGRARAARPLWTATVVILALNLAMAVWRLLTPGSNAVFDEQLQVGVYITALALVGIISLRQIAAIRESRKLYDRLLLSHTELEARNLALVDANATLQTLATTDHLTELPNQRALVHAIDGEIDRDRRYGRTSALLFVDLDHFKTVNDAFGHATGDTVLAEVSGVMRAALRTVDVLGRWGGEEFVAILPEVGADGAAIVAERLREAVAAHTFSSAACHLTASVGVASYPADGVNRPALVDAADKAMYASKQLAHNQALAAEDLVGGPINADGAAVPGDAALAHTVEGLSAMISGRAHYTAGHTSNVAGLAARLALAMGLDASLVTSVKLAARLHDIGKVAVPDAVLLKPGRLNDDEWMLMRRHPIVGADVVSRIHGLDHVAPMIRSHHERWDGVGYPDGLMGEDIPLGARILAVADAYAAMTQGRAYQAAREPEWAFSELRRCASSQFDPAVVAAMERVLQADRSKIEATTQAG